MNGVLLGHYFGGIYMTKAGYKVPIQTWALIVWMVLVLLVCVGTLIGTFWFLLGFWNMIAAMIVIFLVSYYLTLASEEETWRAW